jgi:hypothetical protein
MSRRRTLPGADELFRSTGDTRVLAAPDGLAAATVPLSRADQLLEDSVDAAPVADGQVPDQDTEPAAPRPSARRRTQRKAADRRPSGRERHDEKITVYVSGDELLDLEHARLTLRGDHGLAVDRGRIVREALAYVLADLDAKGDASILVRRVRGR